MAFIPNCRNPVGRNLWAVDKQNPNASFQYLGTIQGAQTGTKSLWLSQQHPLVSEDSIFSLKYIPYTEIATIECIFHHFNEEAHFNLRLCLKVKAFD